MEMIKSISYDQQEILNNILALHVPNRQIDCDCTYSKGVFYRNNVVPEPLMKFDINPVAEKVIMADSRNLPLNDESIDSMIFDPPFLATKGPSLQNASGNIINKRFGVYSDEKSLHRFYSDSMKEAYRILRPNGVLIFKCQDKVSSNKQYFSHVFVMNEATKIGFYPKDLFVLLAKNRICADWQVCHQKNARKYHCYFWVFQKKTVVIEY